MSDFGSGVSRTLSPQDRAFAAVIWQKGKPPLDSELNLMAQVDWERFSQYVRTVMPSGFFLDPTRADNDFRFNPNWVNHFHLGNPRGMSGVLDADETQPVVWANVNGWIVPVAGTDITTNEGVHNVVKLFPPPESDDRIDFVFLEVWQASVQPNPSTLNKPTASEVWKFGNVKHGGVNIADDIEDPETGYETTKRLQIQYRLRVFGEGVGLGQGIALDVHPDGLGDPNVLGQGAASAPVSGFQWSNMREELGDPSLWRAGDGDPNNNLKTVDGFTYAIPVCAVFRRSSQAYIAVKASGNPHQMGAFIRQPGAKTLVNPLDGAVPLLAATLTDFLAHDTGADAAGPDAVVDITNLNGSGLEDTALVLSSTFLVIDNEIVGLSNVDLVNNQITIPAGERGRWGTAAVGHSVGAVLKFFNTRPDVEGKPTPGLYADEIASSDILDLRRGVNPGDWDYTRILTHNVGALAKGNLRTAWKVSNPGDTEGVTVHEVVELFAADNTVPNHSDAADGPDGIRTVWSDGATIQPDVTLLLDNEATRDGLGQVGFTNPTFDATVQWDVAADFKPIGFMNSGASGADGWTNGSSIHIFIGGSTGSEGARATFRSGTDRDVRFVTPREYWRSGFPVVDRNNGNQHPVQLRFLDEKAQQTSPADLTDDQKALFPGPMYPWRESRFEEPYLVLGGLLADNLRVEGLDVAALNTVVLPDGSTQFEIDFTAAGVNFDTVGIFHNNTTGTFPNEPSQVTTAMLRGLKTFFGLLTAEGRDQTGASTEVYLATWGDISGVNNNGGFRVVGAGTVGYTSRGSKNPDTAKRPFSLVVEPLSTDFTDWSNPASENVLTVDFRSQFHNADDTSNFSTRVADLVVVLTDIGGDSTVAHPWNKDLLGEGESYDLSLPTDPANADKRIAESKAVLSLTLMYHPGRSAMTRVPDEVVRFAMRGGAEATIGTYLRRSPSTLDPTFSAIGTATDETYWSVIQAQTWNRLPGLGWNAPFAPNYGGNVVGFTEQDRESELFVDRGSKAVIFRPFRNRDMTLNALTFTELPASTGLQGSYTYPDLVVKDSLQILTGTSGAGQGTSGKQMGFQVPHEFMPRFGRQDIPFYELVAGNSPPENGFMPGINHLFTDVTDLTDPVFNIIGGEKNDGGTEVNPLFFQTRASEIAYGCSLSNFGPNQVGTYGARKTTDIDPNTGTAAQTVIADLAAVNSSDLGRGLKGIQLPPGMGIARLFGVYEFEDYDNKGGTSFGNDRFTPDSGSAINLLREDADKQTLFILQDGGQDLTEELDQHTYIIPSNALDLTRIPADPGGHAGWLDGTSLFGDFDYVVECTVFFFAKGFINENNLVLVRRVSGGGNVNTDGDDPELENVPMCIPSPAGLNDHLYVAYNRTVYQGDPYMTRDGGTRQTADYENRYGRLSVSQENLLRTAIQQFDSAGNYIPERDNDRAFQVLASMDFYTTLGTGKIGGQLYPGTPLDVGYIENSPLGSTRMPLSPTEPPWRVQVRAFTDGQKTNPSRARATLEILSNESLFNATRHGEVFQVHVQNLDGSIVSFFGLPEDVEATYVAAESIPATNVFRVDTTERTNDRIFDLDGLDFGTLTPGLGAMHSEIAIDAGGFPLLADELAGIFLSVGLTSISITPKTVFKENDFGSVLFDARISADDEITIRANFTVNPTNFEFISAAGGAIRTETFDFATSPVGPLSVGTVLTLGPLSWPGARHDGTQVFSIMTDGLILGFLAEVIVPADDEISIKITNVFSTPNTLSTLTDFHIVQLDELTVADWGIDLSDTDVTVHITQEEGDKQVTASNLAAAVTAHPLLSRTVRAFNNDSPQVIFESIPTGAEGNGIRVSVSLFDSVVTDLFPALPQALPLPDTFRLEVPLGNDVPVGGQITSTPLFGGVDAPVNAGNGTSQISLTGMTERFPLGVLLQDSDFLCENPLGDDASAMNSNLAGLRPIQTLIPLTSGGEEFERFLGEPGSLLALADVQIAPQSFAAWTEAAPDGATKKFRIYRGGGAAFVLGGENPGGPIDWVSESFPASVTPVLKGGVLACRAMLVRNFYEEALPTDGPVKTTDGDEIQMVILTFGHLGGGSTQENGITMDGIISPAGYGEGYAAADRYRCMGRPMIGGRSRVAPDPAAVDLAVFPEQEQGAVGDTTRCHS